MGNIFDWKKSIPVTIKNRQHPIFKMQSIWDKLMEEFYTSNMLTFQKKDFENLMINPAIDIINDKDYFKVEAEMPGMGEEDISIEVNDGVLIIKGRKEISKQNKDKDYLMREISYGSYERTIDLPDSVDIDKVKATFKKGMLWVDIPKKPDYVNKNRKVNIEKL